MGRVAKRSLTRHVCASALALLALAPCLFAHQEQTVVSSDTNSTAASGAASNSDSSSGVKALSDSVTALQAEIRALNSQIADLRAAEAHSDEEVRALQEQVLAAEGKGSLVPANGTPANARQDPQQNSASAAQPNAFATPMNSNAAMTNQSQSQSLADRVSQLEEGQELVNSKLEEQSQTKVESGSKYRVRLSGIVLLNMFENRGVVDNSDFPSVALESEQPFSSASFGASLRQSQIGIEAFGPKIGGARTSASIDFDFAGGFPQDTVNGETMGIIRLRTGVVRFDWQNTSLIAGQDRLFFVPNAPTSIATLAVPALSYAGNLWSWTPQVRVEHKIPLSNRSSLLLQAGMLDSLSGDVQPEDAQAANPSWGEQSGQPAWAARVGWTHSLHGQELTLGTGGYYGRQFWGYGRNVDGWASTIDVAIPLSKMFSLAGAYYRGRAVAGLWGALGQDVVMSGSLFNPTAVIKGLDSTGGWMQLKFKPRDNFQINAAYGSDNPFAGELDRFPNTFSYTGYLYTRNQSPFVNFIYQFRSDVEVSLEYRHLKTWYLDDETQSAGQYNATIGYKF